LVSKTCVSCFTKNQNTVASLLQWPPTCTCGARQVESSPQDITIHFCKGCGKPIGAGRPGSFFQFIVRCEVCSWAGSDRCAEITEAREQTNAANQIEQTYFGIDEQADEIIVGIDREMFPRHRFRPIQLLSSGAGALVFLARDMLLGRRVAVKVLRTLDQAGIAALQNEARAISKCDHPSLVRLLDFGVTPNATPYMVLSYPGRSLREILAQRGSLNWRLCCNLFADVCDALHHANTRGVFHHRLKPANVLMLEDGDKFRVCIIDFGLAKIKDQSVSMQNGFASPYCQSDAGLAKEFDIRWAVHSVACILFEALTGNPPFDGDELLQPLFMQTLSPPATLSLGETIECPRELEHVIIQSLSVDPDRRLPSLFAFAQTLRHIASMDSCSSTKESSCIEGNEAVRAMRHLLRTAETNLKQP